MPIFEYVCKSCGHAFETLVQGSRRPRCPQCGKGRLDKQLSVFATSTSSPDSRSELPEPCRSCGDPAGPGSCALKH